MSQQSESSFTIFPAIDLRGGRVVRLREGDFGREDVYGDDPAETASAFAAAGARWIHVVDLEGAVAGESRQGTSVAAILERVRGVQPGGAGRLEPPICVQVAGGIRTTEAVASALATGASRVVVGTAALRDPRWVATLVDAHGPERIAVALDIRNGEAVGDGWVAGAVGVPVGHAVMQLEAAGVRTFIATAIDRDGLLGGPDLALLEDLAGRTSAALIASGGIAHLDDLRAVRAIGCAGAIVGRALYEGAIDLAEALAAVS
ncbi:MAG TPA: 1-(5-phosphoribosyl)-5-[(5-phosphoribosylamino)methylideneamino] imidazole-4-carboxamide isomerase [Candidatus Limnocylindrales bacterium]